MSTAVSTPPELMFSHFGVYCTDVKRLEEFYTRVLGFAVSDAGDASMGIYMTFMTRRPREHHQFVLGAGRDADHPTTVSEVGFKAPDLAELRRIKTLLDAEDEAHDVVAVDHGIAWTLYFRDAENIRSSVSVETGWYVPQPASWPLDLTMSDDDIARETEARCRATQGFMPRAEWRDIKDQEFRGDGRFTAEAFPTGNANPDFAAPVKAPDRILLRTAGEGTPPRIAMSHVGYFVSDLAMMRDFYTNVLGYAITGEGRTEPVGAEPARDCIYLSRDPTEHQQVILVAGRDPAIPSSINQLSLRITSLPQLRELEKALKADPRVGNIRYTCHGNSFSIYFEDPEGNYVELAVESVWYVPAPSGWFLDLSLNDKDLIEDTERRVREVPGFLMRADWKALAREELIATGRLEAEGLVSDVA